MRRYTGVILVMGWCSCVCYRLVLFGKGWTDPACFWHNDTNHIQSDFAPVPHSRTFKVQTGSPVVCPVANELMLMWRTWHWSFMPALQQQYFNWNLSSHMTCSPTPAAATHSRSGHATVTVFATLWLWPVDLWVNVWVHEYVYQV